MDASSSSAVGPRAGFTSPQPTKRRSTSVPAPGEGGGSAIATLKFTKREKIRTRPEIDRVFTTGRRYSCKGMRIHVATNDMGVDRTVIVAVHSYPGAVQRNRARRVLRECWRLCGPERRPGFDVAIVLFPGTDEFAERDRQLRLLLLQAGILGGRS